MKKTISGVMMLAIAGSMFVACNNAGKTQNENNGKKEEVKKEAVKGEEKPAENVSTENNATAKTEETTTNTSSKNKTAENKEKPMVGNDRDAHGCIGSAGYTWSEVKKECIQIFASGTALTAVDPSLNKSLAAYVVFNEDQTKAELFMASVKGSKVLQRKGSSGSYTWESGAFKLSSGADGYVLKEGSKTLYAQDK